MIAFLADEDFNARILRGLLRRIPDLSVVTVYGESLSGQDDSMVLIRAAEQGRVLLTHDVNSMIAAALERVRSKRPMPGLVAVAQSLGIGAVIDDLVLIATCAEPQELAGQIWYLPL